MMIQKSLEEVHPFHIPGLKVKAYDPKNRAILDYWGQALTVTFSNPVDDSRYERMDIDLGFTPNRDLIVGSVWPGKDRIRLHSTCEKASLSFFPEAVELYQEEVAGRIQVLFNRILRRVLASYLSNSIELHYNTRLSPNLSFVTLTLNDRLNGQRIRFAIGYHFKEEVFYARYSMRDNTFKGERQTFDSNDPLREVLVDLCQSLIVDMRHRGWTS